jgi:hypothetical protein
MPRGVGVGPTRCARRLPPNSIRCPFPVRSISVSTRCVAITRQAPATDEPDARHEFDLGALLRNRRLPKVKHALGLADRTGDDDGVEHLRLRGGHAHDGRLHGWMVVM